MRFIHAVSDMHSISISRAIDMGEQSRINTRYSFMRGSSFALKLIIVLRFTRYLEPIQTQTDRLI